MTKTYTQRHPYISAFLVALICTFITAFGSALPQVLELEEDLQILVTTGFLILSIIVAVVIMKKSRFTVSEFGIRRSEEGSAKKVAWYLPLAVIEILPILVYGFNPEIMVQQYIILLLFTVAVGFNEEIYFRGLARKFMEEKGRKKAILGTSIIFGSLHLINALNGKTNLYLVLQVFFAFLVGFVLAEVVFITKSLWIAILWHAVHDYISSITGDSLDSKALIILAIQVVVLVIYAVCIWKKSSEETLVTPLANN
ncbi:MAG: type II CAAX endopeptidase family protein [Mobilitalea sp.]